MNADWSPGGRQPSYQADVLGLWVRWLMAATIHIHRHHLLLLLCPKADNSHFTVPLRAEGWFILTLCRSNPMVKIVGQSLQSEEERMLLWWSVRFQERSFYSILSLQARRVDLSKRFFRNICKPDNCLHHLVPPPRDLAVTSHLRKPTTYPRPSLRTKRYCSAVSYALLNFQ